MVNLKEIDASRLNSGANEQEGDFSTIEASAVKKIVRESWEAGLKDRGTSLDILNEHAAFMSREFSAIDYETLCMQSIAARAKHMSKGELLAYTKAIEALALGYKARFGTEFAGLLVAGITLVAKDVKSVRKHMDYFIGHLSKSAEAYEKMLAREVERLGRLDSKLKSRNSGILRFLRKREVDQLRKGISTRRARIGRFTGRKDRYSKLAEMVRSWGNLHHARKR